MDDASLCFFVLSTSIYSQSNDIKINRFLKKEDATFYFEKLQGKAIKNRHKEGDKDKFGFLTQKGTILAKYGNYTKIEAMLNSIKEDVLFKKY